MKNSVENVKKSLVRLIDDKNIRVFALRGKWGTGKTHLWNAIHQARQGAGAPINSVKVSLFGIRSIQELKLQLFQNIYFKDTPKANIANFVGGLVSSLAKKYTGYSLEESARLMLPSLIKTKLIVIDDIERKHNALDIAELLGLIDEFSLIYDARFLLLLNTDELADKQIWAKLHEKVIDADLLLAPSPAESFSIASHEVTYEFLPELQNAIEILEITNIRILKSIVRLCTKIAHESRGLSDSSNARWVPSSVLLGAVHYMAFDNSPSLTEIEEQGSFLFESAWSNSDNSSLKKWNAFVNALGRINFFAMERVVTDYLKTGIIDNEKLMAELEIYRDDAQEDSLHSRVTDFIDTFEWDSAVTQEELLAKARLILPDAKLLAPHIVSSLVQNVKSLGDHTLAQELLDCWTTSLAENSQHLKTDAKAAGITRKQYNPEVSAALEAIRNVTPPSLTLIEAIDRIGNENWGEREIDALLNANTNDYRETLHQLSGPKLQSFMMKHIKWARDSSADEWFLAAEQNFLAACRQVYRENQGSRLSTIIERLFILHSLSLDEVLDASPPTPLPVATSPELQNV